MPVQKTLSRYGVYIILIPLFFVLHGYVQNFGLISFRDCFLLLITYWVAILVLYGVLWLFFHEPRKASFMSGVLFSFFLFFGAIDDFLKTHWFLLSRYKVIIPLFLIGCVFLFFYLNKTKRLFFKATFFINLLLIIYLVIDLFSLGWKLSFPNADKLSIYGGNSKDRYKPCDSCQNPDIYFLLFDEYSSSQALLNSFHYDNLALDSFLTHKGFSVQSGSRSNYNFTPFSMASLLNFNYIDGIKNPSSVSVEDYAKCNNLIRNNEVVGFLSSRNYEIVNFSIFDLAGNPSLIESSLLPVKTRLITEQTLFNRVLHNIAWNLNTSHFDIMWPGRNPLYENLENNTEILSWINQETRRKNEHPRFVYAHFEMPHPPYYFDKRMRQRNSSELAVEKSGYPVDSYTGYLPYTNNKIMQLVDTLQKNTYRSAVIIIMGDHGYRMATNDSSNYHFFQNLNAVFFPNGSRPNMPDNISGVNQFRIIFNQLFHQGFPMLKDTCVFLKDRE